MTKEKQFARAKAIAVLECMAIDLTGALAESSKTNPMTEVLEQRLEAIDTAQAALREQPRWISVEERLPSGWWIEPDTGYREPEEYIVFVKGAIAPTVANCIDGKFTNIHQDGLGFADVITHWMPLPEPPEVEV